MDTDYSREGLLSFLQYLGEKGLMPKGTVEGRKAAARQMLEILDADEARDLRQLNVGELAARFANLRGSRYTSESMQIYRSRLLKSLEDFMRYRDDPLNFKVDTQRQPGQGKPTVGKQRSARSPRQNSGSADDARRSLVPYEARHPQTQTITVPIAIRPSCVVLVNGLPVDLTESEASKIAAVIVAMGTG